MACSDSIKCGVRNVRVTWVTDSGTFTFDLAGEGDLVTYDQDENAITTISNNSGTRTAASSPARDHLKTTINLRGFPCDENYQRARAAYKADNLTCGTLTVEDECCDDVQFEEVRGMSLPPRDISSEIDYTDFSFTGYETI